MGKEENITENTCKSFTMNERRENSEEVNVGRRRRRVHECMNA